MHRNLRIAAVMPAYNEQDFIAGAVEAVRRTVVDDVIVIDDASSDLTASRAERAGASVVIRHHTNKGVGGALITGFRAAVERGNDVVVVIPGDGQADFKALEPMLDNAAAGYGLVISDRLSGRDATKWGMPRYRVVGSRVLSMVNRVATGLAIPDPQSGFKAIRKEAIQRLPLDDLYPRWGFHNDVLSYCALLHIPVCTVPAEPVYHSPDGRAITSHIKLWDLIPRHIRVFSAILLRRVRWTLTRRPEDEWPWRPQFDSVGQLAPATDTNDRERL